MSQSASSSSAPSPAAPYVCDTIPPARLALQLSTSRSPSPLPVSTPPVTAFQAPIIDENALTMRIVQENNQEQPQQPAFDPFPVQPPRKLCVRHQRMADEGTNLKLQQALDALPIQEREAVNAVWTNFSSSPHPRRALILQGLLTMCCFSQLSLLTEQLAHLIRIDPFTVFPREVSLKVLQYLDAISLCRAAQVSKTWKSLADDDILWRGICEQHIGQKCLKCGWGLPILERRRALRISPSSPSPSPSIYHPSSQHVKRELDHDVSGSEQPAKRLRLSAAPSDSPDSSLPIQSPVPSSSSHPAIHPTQLLDPGRTSTPNPLVPSASGPQAPALTRPWKDVYCERLTIERNWRRGRCTVRTLKGHADGVMCLQFSETLSHPAFPILITGSYDRTARVWNLETGRELHCLTGHTRAVRALQFDEVKLITGSMDHTMKVWDWRTGKCLRTLEGHTEGVVCLNFDSNVLASGSVDTTVKVWNFRTGECFTLRGHREWVNAVHLWDAGTVTAASFRSSPGSLSPRPSSPSTVNGQATIDPGKMLFSASDDGTIRLWDLSDRCCVRQFTGHVGQVQSLKLLTVDKGCDDDEEDEEVPTIPSPSLTPPTIRDQDLRDPGRSSRSGNNLLPSHTDAFTSGSGSNPFAYITPTPSSSTLSTTIAALTGSSSLPPMASSSTVNPEGLHVPSAAGPTYTNASIYLDGNTATLNSKGKGRELGQHGSTEPTERPSSSASSSSHHGIGGGGSGVGVGVGGGKKNKSKPVLISGSLDNMIKLWDIDSGKVTKTFFGHIEGVWAVACDNLRLVSGSHDRTIKVWNRDEGICTATLVGHRGAVTCLALADDKIVSGSDDGDIRVWSFSG